MSQEDEQRKAYEDEKALRIQCADRAKQVASELTEELSMNIGSEVIIDEVRRANGLAPRYGYRGKPGVLRSDDGGRVPTATTPKIYTGGDGSNHDPPVAGAATVQRTRETADAERSQREQIIAAAMR